MNIPTAGDCCQWYDSDDKERTTASDVFSLGKMLLELFDDEEPSASDISYAAIACSSPVRAIREQRQRDPNPERIF